jgi:polysaccharide export outer membrane protein
MSHFFKLIILQLMMLVSFTLHAAPKEVAPKEPGYTLDPGDLIRITVFNNPDLTLETRVPESGAITYPLIGEVQIGGVTPSVAEKRIASALEKGGFLKKPQVNILVVEFQSKLVSILGGVLKPGRYPINRETTLADLLATAGGISAEGSDLIAITDAKGKKEEYDLSQVMNGQNTAQNVKLYGGETVFVNSRNVTVMGQVNRPGKYSIVSGVRTVADFLSMAGGINPEGSDTITVTTIRNGKASRIEVDVDSLFRTGDPNSTMELQSGDSIYVPQAPMVYVYGEVQRPGSFKIQRNMTVMQVISQGGGLTPRGTQRGIKINRRNAKGEIEVVSPKLTDLVKADDVVYVQESLF